MQEKTRKIADSFAFLEKILIQLVHKKTSSREKIFVSKKKLHSRERNFLRFFEKTFLRFCENFSRSRCDLLPKKILLRKSNNLAFRPHVEATLAQLVEHLIRNERVVGSSPTSGSTF